MTTNVPSAKVGEQYGRLIVISLLTRIGGGKKGICRCVCGTERVFNLRKLISGNTRSCGCLKREMDGTLTRTHGMSGGPEHQSWSHIKQRCFNKTNSDYKDYGGRGITMCARWRDSFEAFLSDVGPRPDGYSIERDDVNGDYEPSNCRWIPKSEQNSNKRNTHWVNFNGSRVPMREFCQLTATVSPLAIKSRIQKGWDATKALSTPRLTGHGTKEERRQLGIE